MKTIAFLTVLAAGFMLFGSAGCNATPAYSLSERFQRISRNEGYEYNQIADDTDDFWLLRPAGHLTIWNVQ